jgi:hypothetical protein
VACHHDAPTHTYPVTRRSHNAHGSASYRVSPVAVWHPFGSVEPISLFLPTTMVFVFFSSLSHEIFLTVNDETQDVCIFQVI